MARIIKRVLSPERRQEVLSQLSEASSPGFDFFLLVTLSAIIATLGLVTNSTAVIIGAMLVAPLMSPILGLSLASVAGEQYVFRRALVSLTEGAVLAVILSAVISWLAQSLPFDLLTVLPSEVISRTRPTPLDLGIALAGGAAASYALAQPRLSAALPGVAIATALMPPLCTIGIGISMGNTNVSLGALLLFVTNLVTILFAGILVFALLGFRPVFLNDTIIGLPRGLFVASILVLIVTIPLVALTLRFVGDARLSQDIKTSVQDGLRSIPDAQLVDVQYTYDGNELHIEVTVRTSNALSYQQVVQMQTSLANQLDQPVALQIVDVPVIRLNPLYPPTHTPTPTPGPSPTATNTPTFTPSATSTPLPTDTPVPTSTVTPTSTPTTTPTPTLTPTPIPARVVSTGGRGIYLREAPVGKIIGLLREGDRVQVLYNHEQINGLEWVQIRDSAGREGWIPATFLVSSY